MDGTLDGMMDRQTDRWMDGWVVFQVGWVGWFGGLNDGRGRGSLSPTQTSAFLPTPQVPQTPRQVQALRMPTAGIWMRSKSRSR